MKGMYVIFEGNDGVGKTTTMKAVVAELEKRYPNFSTLLTHHPGSTPLGKHLRKLVKTPELIDPNISIDELSRQMLYMVDTVSFIKSLLLPSLNNGINVFADRSSFISALVYGLADGLSSTDISKLFDIISAPRADRLYVLQCPWEVGKQRIAAERTQLDHYDRKGEEFFRVTDNLYNSLLTGSEELSSLVLRTVKAKDLIYVDTTLPKEMVVDIIVNDISARAKDLNLL